MSLVESCPSTEMRSNERFTHTPSSRSAVSARSAASVWTKQSIVANAGRDHPRALGLRAQPHRARRQRDLERGVLDERVGGADRLAEVVRRRRARARAERAAIPRMTLSVSSGTPITPVEATATRSSSTPATIAPAPCMRAASSRPRRPVAALALPELATTARIPASWQRSWVSRTGAAQHAGAREARGAHGVGGVGDEQTEVAAAGGLEPQATPAARKPAGSPLSSSVTCSGGSTQRELKLTGPRSRRGRTSG